MFSAAILCGGASRRMGRDKALIEIDGVPMIERVLLAAEAAGADDVWAVGRTTFSAWGRARVIPDEVPGAGPLGGILTALRHTTHDVTLIVSCDLLHPSPEAFRRTVEATADVAVPVVEGHAQWLHAAWHRRSVEHLQGRFDAGERSVRRAVDGLTVAWVDGISANALADADTPEDLLNAGVETGTSLPFDEHSRDHGP